MHSSASLPATDRFPHSRRLALIASIAAAAMLAGCSEQAVP